jgi:hypothetical protein
VVVRAAPAMESAKA